MLSKRRNAHQTLEEVELIERDSDSDSDSDAASEDDQLLSPSKSKMQRGLNRSTSTQRAKSSCWRNMFSCFKSVENVERNIPIGRPFDEKFLPNVFKNQKYNMFTFVPLVLINQYKFFLDMFFLAMAVSQFIPELKVGLIYTYWGPLAFVTMINMCQEGLDEYRRFKRDKEVNSSRYYKLTPKGKISVSSAELKVSDLVYVEKKQRVPADMILLRTTEPGGSCFLRTDQLDGETDWKSRETLFDIQNISGGDSSLFNLEGAFIKAEAPSNEIHTFNGTLTIKDHTVSLNIENTMWANTVVASGTALGIVIYSGPSCRAVMGNKKGKSKSGIIDKEVNFLTFLLFLTTIGLSLILTGLKGFYGLWYAILFRFVLLFSYLIPISLRVNMDLGKVFYCYQMKKDKDIPGAVARTTKIPEELGRINYLVSDKTGTLTQNEMVFKRLHIGTNSYSQDNFNEVQLNLSIYFSDQSLAGHQRHRRAAIKRLGEAVKAIALCHNVTPVHEIDQKNSGEDYDELATEAEQIGALPPGVKTSFQAASPDEIALAQWCDLMGLALIERTQRSIKLRCPDHSILSFTILQIFPFSSESRRMGIILKDDITNEHVFYLKGADVVMATKVIRNDWLEEEVGDLAREGLRTLVVAKKNLTPEQYKEFEHHYNQAKNSMINRAAEVGARIESLERDMELLCVTGVEDKLQPGVRETLERLRNAGIRVWMLTGDKLETANCIAKSSGLFSRSQKVHIFKAVTDRTQAHHELRTFGKKQDFALIINGDSLKEVLRFYDQEFISLVANCPAVVCCRCSPEQKSDMVHLIKNYTKKSVAAIGDGGNDIPMIQAANAGIGIVGKEGLQASLAADFSLTQFSHVSKLLLAHGRNSYKRTASLSQFIFHRGIIISTMQAVFSGLFSFAPVLLFPSVLMLGYATLFTTLPVFSLVLDQDVSGKKALELPELYRDLLRGRSLSFKTFFLWVVISIYQGGALIFGALLLFEDQFYHFIGISFSGLILTELIMVALTIRTWHWMMVFAEISSLFFYIVTIFALTEYFDLHFILTLDFLWKTVVITSVSCLPLYIIKLLRFRINPPIYQRIA